MQKNLKKYSILAGLIGIFFWFFVYGIDQRYEGYRLPAGNTREVWGGSGGLVCRMVQSDTSYDLFVPTKSDREWQASGGFLENHPDYINIAPCECKESMDCGGGVRSCDGYQAPSLTGTCQGTADICDTSQTIGLIGTTSVKVDSCSSNGSLVTYGDILYNDNNEVIGLDGETLGGGSNFGDLTGCHTEYDTLCKTLTNQGDSNVYSIYAESSTVDKRISTPTCGQSNNNITAGHANEKRVKRVTCTYDLNGATCSTITGSALCGATTGCTFVPTSGEVMGQCNGPA